MDIDADRAQRLFQAIVTQALIDATAPDKKFSTKPIKRRADDDDLSYAKRNKTVMAQRERSANLDRIEARAWLLADEESFELIVSLAGYNPTDIRERAWKLSRAGWKRPKHMPEHALAA